MQLLVVDLALLVSRKARDGTTNGALGTVAQPVAVVANLALCFLLLALEVLLTSGLLQRL